MEIILWMRPDANRDMRVMWDVARKDTHLRLYESGTDKVINSVILEKDMARALCEAVLARINADDRIAVNAK